MEKSCVVRIDTSSSVPAIFLTGEITTFSDLEINDAFGSLPNGWSHAVIDFSSVQYINSAGIAILVSLVTETEKNKQKLLFSGLVAHYRRVMEIVGITEFVQLFDNAQEAIATTGSKE